MTRLAYLVHVYTATGAVWALLSLIAIDAFDYRLALMWLVVATFVDATDGWLARWARVDRHATLINGARLDDIVDYATYVLAPGVLLLHAGRLPEGSIGVTVVCGMLLASALGFTRQDAKTTGALWGVQVLLMIWWMPDVPAWLLWTSWIYPAYYVGLSLALSVRRPGARAAS
jgi:phosphatidylserine synthase